MPFQDKWAAGAGQANATVATKGAAAPLSGGASSLGEMQGRP